MNITRNEIDLLFTTEQVATLSTAMDSLESITAALPTISASERRRIVKMGYKSEAFARDAHKVAKLHPEIVPNGISTVHMDNDLEAREILGELYQRLIAVVSRVQDSHMLAGTDLMKSALIIYRAMKSHGDEAGLGPILASMKKRYDRNGTAQEPEEPAPVLPGNE